VPDPIHLRPTAELAQRALLPGDPGRALALAQALFDKPARMFNHHRGLWGYTGTAIDGGLLTVQSTGMGGPSSAIVLEELCELGLRRAVRVGTCAALGDGARLGELIAVREALAGDGTSRALGAGDVVAGDAALGEALAARADHAGRVACGDLFYDPAGERRDAWRAAGALAFDLETAALFAVARRRGVRAGSLLAVTARAGDRLDGEAIDAAGVRLGRAALAALADGAATPR
jgi:uridine phosphorylase